MEHLGELSVNFQIQVEGAYQRQREWFSIIESSNVISNADLRVGEVRQFWKLDIADGLEEMAEGKRSDLRDWQS